MGLDSHTKGHGHNSSEDSLSIYSPIRHDQDSGIHPQTRDSVTSRTSMVPCTTRSFEAETNEPHVILAGIETSCSFELFKAPSARSNIFSHEDSMILKYLITLHRSLEDPALYFKWGVWRNGGPDEGLRLEDILETEVQLVTWNKQIKKDCSGEAAYLRLGLHPDRICGKVAFQISLRDARNFFQEVASVVLRELLSLPMAIYSTYAFAAVYFR
ncbi:hypothetical protein METBIDRAFT_29351 [Metschnikowia bicuspidata var. bicuspidata NRRL YB-4993]|uniref:Uncharacterized protein n=1 Tax=Metschnikowia bicuspidata var. bicuspidata NRRL YB-4993 TaxID=869754 RepID=A0A1A0HF45_9ASCO|nr:hypothetical protein METBIDRAFT_29351 [Metschnikowia bicuspidata var. bicuspidata NRRL YB-4993]OBA22754.1 hypothetical protein METBIDRAFT_29351 [Metschnikowia bicuspidata var. bicuspidata NRRL YB-4993]